MRRMIAPVAPGAPLLSLQARGRWLLFTSIRPGSPTSLRSGTRPNGAGLLATAAAAHPDPVTGFVCVRL